MTNKSLKKLLSAHWLVLFFSNVYHFFIPVAHLVAWKKFQPKQEVYPVTRRSYVMVWRLSSVGTDLFCANNGCNLTNLYGGSFTVSTYKLTETETVAVMSSALHHHGQWKLVVNQWWTSVYCLHRCSMPAYQWSKVCTGCQHCFLKVSWNMADITWHLRQCFRYANDIRTELVPSLGKHSRHN